MSRPILNFKRIYILIRKSFDERLSEYNLTTSQFEILGYLYNTDGMEQQKLQHCTGITPATLTGLLDKLENRNYIIRQASIDDARAKNVILTPAGYDICTQLIDIMHHFENDVFQGFSTAERALLGDWLERIADNLGDTEYGHCD